MAAGPELGALQNKLRAIESLKSRIANADQGVAELIKPLPVMVIRKPPPPKPKPCPKPIEVVIEHDDDDCSEVKKSSHVEELKDVLDEKSKAMDELAHAVRETKEGGDIKDIKIDTKSIPKLSKGKTEKVA